MQRKYRNFLFLKSMKTFFKQAHTYWLMFSIALSFYLLFPFVFYFSRKPQRYKKLNFYRRIFAFLSSALAGLFYKYTYQSPINWDKNYIICANHSSNLDSTALTLLGKSNIFFMGKDDLLRNPVTKIWFETIDVPVNRESKMAAFRAYKKATEQLNLGFSLALFPEGIIGETFPPILHPFKNGAFKMAIESKVAILPVSIINSWQLQYDDGKARGSKPGICQIYVHKPIETANLLPVNEDKLKEEVYRLIGSKVGY